MALSKKLRSISKEVDSLIEGDETKFYISLVNEGTAEVYSEGKSQTLPTKDYVQTPADIKYYLGDNEFKSYIRTLLKDVT